jgi:diadenosine tetraphosphatase ApaH/serine/threonine PP2A family protein phosphatase
MFQKVVNILYVKKGLLCDLLWADPDKNIVGWGKNKERGISRYFSKKVLKLFLEKFDMDIVVRGHQVKIIYLYLGCSKWI